MAECRIELFAEATSYDPLVVIGEIAHVAAAKLGRVPLRHRQHCRRMITPI
jgi:hypothetical protein